MRKFDLNYYDELLSDDETAEQHGLQSLPNEVEKLSDLKDDDAMEPAIDEADKPPTSLETKSAGQPLINLPADPLLEEYYAMSSSS